MNINILNAYALGYYEARSGLVIKSPYVDDELNKMYAMGADAGMKHFAIDYAMGEAASANSQQPF